MGRLELDGYPDEQPVPSYRRISAQYYANFMGVGWNAEKQLGGNESQQLLSAVNNRVLDFVLKIDAENPNAGEAPLNTHPVPEEKLQPLVQNFFGPIANIAQSSHGFTQTAYVEIDSTDLKRLVNDLSEHLAELKLSEAEYQRVQAQLATLNAQLTDSPNPVIVREAGRTIRNLTEGAISRLLATAAQPTVWAWIQAMLAHF